MPAPGGSFQSGGGAAAGSVAQAKSESPVPEEQLAALFDNMAEGFAHCRMIFEGGRAQDFVFLQVNKAFERLTGLKDVTGRKASEVMPGLRESDPGIFEVYGRVVETGGAAKFETHVNALKKWFSVSAYRPEPGNFVAVFDVITDRKEAEENVRRLNAALEQRVQDRTVELEAAVNELEAFAYSVSHDLRAPLRAIDGFAEILAQEHSARLDAEGLHVLGIIRKEAAHMGQLINDLLAFSRAGRSEMQVASIDMTALARAAFEECTARVPERRVEFRLDTLLPASGDANLLRQVLVNLVSNAVKYTRPREVAQIEIGSRAEGEQVVYWIKDNGVGFDTKYSNKLFGIFQRLHSDKEFEGTGVGLALVQRIVRRHGGRVWGEAKLDEGATFYFTLPRPQ